MLENLTSHFDLMMQMMIAEPSAVMDHLHVTFNAIPAKDQEQLWWIVFVVPFVPYG